MLVIRAPYPDAVATTRLADFTTGSYNGITPSASRTSQGYAETITGILTLFGANTLRRTNKGLLVESAATNVLHDSLNVGGSSPAWQPGGSSTYQSQITGPDGSTAANVPVFSSGFDQLYAAIRRGQDVNQSGFIYGFDGNDLNTTYTMSLYVKAPASNAAAYARITSNNGNGWNSGISSKLATTTNWQRIVATGIVSDTAGMSNIDVGLEDRTGSYDSDCIGALAVFGFQLESGSAATSLIATPQSGPATRAADAVSFTIPSGVASLIYTFDDSSTQTVAVTAGSQYTIPTNLSRPYIKYIDRG